MCSIRVSAFCLLALAGSVGCGEKKAAEKEGVPETSPPARPVEERFTEVDKVALMEQHYTVAIVAHDMLIRGNLEQFRFKLGALSEQELPDNAPATWRAPHKAMREAAQAAKQATTLDAAAVGMAAVVQTCGVCHAANPKGPIYQRPEAPDGQSLDVKMQRHQWASERLWEGVTGPRDDAWSRGAAALAESVIFDDGKGTGTLLELERKMRKLGEDAKALTTLPERITLYGTLLSTCGACHQQMGVSFKKPASD